jgi:hypothetical protein
MMRVCIAVVACLSAGAAVLSARGASAGWFSYDSYEDCMLGRMKGQDSTMFPTAEKACKKQFNVEFEIYHRIDWKFVYAPAGATVIRLENIPEEYVITSAKFRFTDGDCTGKKDLDFGEPKTIPFKDNSGIAFDPLFVQPKFCGQSMSFRARYK